jgi:hypothetical protein
MQCVAGTPINADKISWGKIIVAVDKDVIVARWMRWTCRYKLHWRDTHVITNGIQHSFFIVCCNTTPKLVAIPSSGETDDGRSVSFRNVVFNILAPGVLHLIKINHQPDAPVFSVYYPDFCLQLRIFGRFPAHHQELNNCSGSLWFYLRIVVTVVLCSWSGRPADRPDHEHSTTITTIRR